MPLTDHDPRGTPSDIELRLPADGAYVSVLRTTAAGLAARLDFTMDDIEDLRIAVGEACAMVLPEADPGSALTCRFLLQPGKLTVSVAVSSETAPAPDQDSFGWQVLATLADVTARSTAGEFAVTMTMHTTLPEVGA